MIDPDRIQQAERIKQLERVAEAAIKLFRPPYKRGSGILLPPVAECEQRDFMALRQALNDADYGWEEYC